MGGRGGSEEKAWKSFGSEVPAVTCWVTTMVIFGSPLCRGGKICATGHDLRPSFCSSVFFVDPDNREIVLLRYFKGPSQWGSSNISGTFNFLGGDDVHLYCWEPREVRGANPGMKKCSLLRQFRSTSNINNSYFVCLLRFSPREGNHVDGKLSQISVQLAREPGISYWFWIKFWSKFSIKFNIRGQADSFKK